MSLSKDLFHIQQFDTSHDTAQSRIQEIDQILGDSKMIKAAEKLLSAKEETYRETLADFKRTETAVEDHNLKIDQNQKRLYGGTITNPKELEDLQLESDSLHKFLLVLEERQLEAMLALEETETEKKEAEMALVSVREELENLHSSLLEEKRALLVEIEKNQAARDTYLENNQIDELSLYQSIRESSGGIAVSLMISDSCSACGANIPSAIAQEARSPGKLAFCPTCKRILHPG